MRINIELREEELEKIRQLAEKERRTPRDQAAWLLSRALAQGETAPKAELVASKSIRSLRIGRSVKVSVDGLREWAKSQEGKQD